MLESTASTLLAKGLSGLVDQQSENNIMLFLQILDRWNHSYNLTAIRDKEAMIIRHIFDSASIIPWVRGPLLDVGTGAGFPGMVVGLLRKDIPVYLLDSNGKKLRFLRQVVAQLQLQNVYLVHERVEQYSEHRFPCIVSRAYASLVDMTRGCRHLLAKDGYFLAMKGRCPQEEIDDLVNQSSDFVVEQVVPLQVPYLNEDRHVVLLKHRNEVFGEVNG